MNDFKTGLSYFFPQNLVDYITEARKEYQAALSHANYCQKNGVQIEPEEMTKWELVQWYRKCQEYDF
jgi:hypothetical protein